jgi:tetratricopeptide (TPR) repeat protein
MALGMIYEMKKQPDMAITHYRKALEANPNFAPAANNLAFQLAEKGADLNEALSLAQKAKEKFPEDPSLMDTLGWVYYKKGLYDSAIVELSDALEKLPDNPDVNYHLGMAYYKKGEVENARATLRKALEEKPNYEKADEVKALLTELK